MLCLQPVELLTEKDIQNCFYIEKKKRKGKKRKRKEMHHPGKPFCVLTEWM